MDDRCESNLKSSGRLKQEVNNGQVWFCSNFNILFRGHKLFENKPKLPMMQWSSVNSIGGHVRKLDCSVYRFYSELFLNIIFLLCVLSVKIGRIFRF